MIEVMRGRRPALILLLIISLTACGVGAVQEFRPDVTEPPEVAPTIRILTPPPSPTNPPAAPSPTMEAAPTPVMEGPIGTGLRQQTADLLLKYKDCPGLTMAASTELSEIYFPQLDGWVRVLGAPSLQVLRDKAARARDHAVPYEALGYGLETSQSTPEEEWRNLIASTQKAEDLADQYGKLLVMGPGFRLMSRNEDRYGAMASGADIWLFQTQQLQKNPPGPSYRGEVERIVNLIRAGNPDIQIWAQITLPPDREPDADEWLAYRSQIVDLVDGTYVGVYTWDTESNEVLLETIETIFSTVCRQSQ